MPVTFPKAKLKANLIIEQYNMSSPVKVFDLGDMMGVNWDVLSSAELLEKIEENGDQAKIEKIDILNVLGYLSSKDKTFYVNDENNPISQRRFTFAHELGHQLLEHDLMSQNLFRIVTPDKLNDLDTVEEAEANYFAAHLLMPDREVESRLIFLRDCKDVKEVNSLFAELFVVPPVAVDHRLEIFRNENPEVWNDYRVSNLYVRA